MGAARGDPCCAEMNGRTSVSTSAIAIVQMWEPERLRDVRAVDLLCGDCSVKAKESSEWELPEVISRTAFTRRSGNQP